MPTTTDLISVERPPRRGSRQRSAALSLPVSRATCCPFLADETSSSLTGSPLRQHH